MNFDQAQVELSAYRACLDRLRRAYSPASLRALPPGSFFLFGMGPRRKIFYYSGVLHDALSGEVLHAWTVSQEIILPAEYLVALRLAGGKEVQLWEDEDGIWLEEGGQRRRLDGGRVVLPRFEGHPYAPILRVLHQEILVNILDGLPLPNFFVYRRPWLRDSAMMAMVLRQTGNLDLIRAWILGLREPYDRNNAGETEADNLGQALFLVSLVSGASHPLVASVLAEFPRFDLDKTIRGRSDFAEHPVYQTKWAKFGLASLGLPDPYRVPLLLDSYSVLFWWDFRDRHVAVERFQGSDYPYLNWAEAHFLCEASASLGDLDYPLTWEANASQARYADLASLLPAYAAEKLAAPHTWHAAEMFLCLQAESINPYQGLSI
jgi:hypothetical protein